MKFLRKTMKRYGIPKVIITDRLRLYRAAMKVIGNADRQETGRWLNNRAENSHQPFRRRERAMAKFRNAKTLQKFIAIHASIHNHFNQERHLCSRQNFKDNRSAALAAYSGVFGHPAYSGVSSEPITPEYPAPNSNNIRHLIPGYPAPFGLVAGERLFLCQLAVVSSTVLILSFPFIFRMDGPLRSSL